MEIMVSTVIFAIIAVSLLSLFNYVLKINRRSEALRQASQGIRDFVEFLVKEVRNGQIDYYTANGLIYTTGIGPCTPPGTPGAGVSGADTYVATDNRLGIINSENVQECFYYGDASGNYINSGNSSTTGQTTLSLQKVGVTGAQVLNPPNMRVDYLAFYIRPTRDPYMSVGGLAKIQPSVTIVINTLVHLPTGEQVPIYYQTSVSENKYDIPSN